MEQNPYASPAAQPSARQASLSLTVPLAFCASLVVLFAVLPFAFGGGKIRDLAYYEPIVFRTFFAALVIVPVLGIGAFTMLARASGKPLSLGRGVCIAHLIAVSVLTPMLLPKFLWPLPYPSLHIDRNLPEDLTWFAFAEFILLHLALKRFEKPSLLSSLALGVCFVVVELVVIVGVTEVHQQRWRLGPLVAPLQAVIYILTQGPICFWLAWRVRRIHLRSEAHPQSGDDHEAA